MNKFVTIETIGKGAEKMPHPKPPGPNSSETNSCTSNNSELCHGSQEVSASNIPHSRGGQFPCQLEVRYGHAVCFDHQSMNKSNGCHCWAGLRTEVGFTTGPCLLPQNPSKLQMACPVSLETKMPTA